MVLDAILVNAVDATNISYRMALMVRWRSGVRGFSFVFPFPLDEPMAMLEASLLIENVEVSQHVRSANEDKQVTTLISRGRMRRLPRLPLLPDMLVL